MGALNSNDVKFKFDFNFEPLSGLGLYESTN